MASWQTPKTDWSREDGVTAEDLNIIGGDLRYLFDNRALQAKSAIKYFVSASGDDANEGLTASTPFKTIQKAIDTLPKDLSGYNVTIDLTDDYHGGFTASGFHGGTLIISGASNASVGFTSAITITECSSVLFTGLSSMSLQGAIMIYNTHSFISNIPFAATNNAGHACIIRQTNAAFLDSLQVTSNAAGVALYADYNSNIFVESFLAMPGSGTGIQADRGAKVAYSNSNNRANVATFINRGGRIVSGQGGLNV